MIEPGIRQPLRFYDSPTKQNWRREWTRNGGFKKQAILICPENALLPFQIRRRRSMMPVTTFDLYSFDAGDFGYNFSMFTIIPAPSGDHLQIVSMSEADNIVWRPIADLSPVLPCGLHYVHLSDGSNDWYSEVFGVIVGFEDKQEKKINIMETENVTSPDRILINATEYLLTSNIPF